MVPRLLQFLSLGFWLLLLPLPSRGVTNPAWFFRAWQTGDGLPEHTIVGLSQAPDGYLWVATHEGLFRFDGVRFQEFIPAGPANSPGAQFRVLLQDARGQLWIARDGGAILCLRDGVLVRELQLPVDLPHEQPRTLVMDGEGALWASDNGPRVYRLQDGQATPFTPNPALTNSPCRLTTDRQGRLWFAQAGRVGIFRQGAFVTLLSLGQPADRLVGARAGGIWICSGSNLYRYTEGAELEAVAPLKLEAGRTEVEVTVLYEDTAGGLWIGTGSGGLLRFDSGRVQTIDSGLPSITAITEDREGDLWVGARGAGLNRLRPRAAELIGVNAGLPFVAVQSAAEAADGTLWLAGQNGALVRRTGDQWQLVSEAQGWPGGSVTCLAAEPGGGVLLGTREAGLFREAQGRFRPVPLPRALGNSFLRSLLVATNGDLWIGPDAGSILVRHRAGQFHVFDLPGGSKNVRTMVMGPRADLWAGTSDGKFLQIVGTNLTDVSATIGNTAHAGIRCLHFTEDGSLWIGYSGRGLGLLKNGRYFGFNRALGLGDDYISQIVADDYHRLWIGGNRGIYQVALSELDAVARGEVARLRSVVLGREDGLPNLEATFGIWPNSVHCRDGRLLLPMQTGIAVIQPGLLGKHAPPPPVKIETFRVNGRTQAAYGLPAMDRPGEGPLPINLQEKASALVVPPGVNQLDIEFTALSLASPENVVFRYQLEGVDRGWVEAGAARSAHYASLAPGHFRFHVTACGHDGVWNPRGDVLDFTINSHLWERTWFRLISAAATAGAVAGLVVLLVRRRYQLRIEKLEQRQALERERTRIAQDLHDDLGAGLVEINLGSELAGDPSLTPEELREQTREIAARARQMVTALDEIVWAVNPKHDTVSSLATYFCQFAQHFLAATPIRCQLEVARDLPPSPLDAEKRHSLFLAFKEALCNLVQHSRANAVRLTIGAAAGQLTITLTDDGCGTDLQAPRTRAGADGLDNMRRRLAHLGGHCAIQSAPGQGLTVTFTVPLELAATPATGG